jgi:hypothetical protein
MLWCGKLYSSQLELFYANPIAISIFIYAVIPKYQFENIFSPPICIDISEQFF